MLKTDVHQSIPHIIPNNRTFTINKINYTASSANSWLISFVIIEGMMIIAISLTVIAVAIIRKPQHNRQQLEMSTYIPGVSLKPTYTF